MKPIAFATISESAGYLGLHLFAGHADALVQSKLLPDDARAHALVSGASWTKGQKKLYEVPSTDTEILDWLERQHTLHRAVEVLYVVDGYQVDITSDGARCAGPWQGATLREAYLAAMREWDVTHGGRDLIKEKLDGSI